MSSNLLSRGEAGARNVFTVHPNLILRERQEAARKAALLLARAKQKARGVLRKAHERAEQMREAGRREGRQAGFGELAGRIAEVAAWKKQAMDAHLPGLVRLAREMARRILREELALRPERVRAICVGVVQESRPGGDLVLLVHPKDLCLLQRAGHRLCDQPEVALRLEPCERVERGGCIVRGEEGEVDARLDVQLDTLCRVLCEGVHEDDQP